MRINKEYIPLLLLSSVMYAANAFVEIQADLLLGNFIDNAGNGDLHAISMNCIAMIILLLLFLLTAKAAIYFRMLYVKREMVALKKELLSDIMSMRLRDYLRSDQAYYLNLMTNDADKMGQDYFRSFPLIIFYLCKVILCIGYMLTIHWILLVVYAVLLTLPVIVSSVAGKKLAVKQKESSAANERFLFSLRDIIAGFETIKLGSAEQDASARFDAVNESVRKRAAGCTTCG